MDLEHFLTENLKKMQQSKIVLLTDQATIIKVMFNMTVAQQHEQERLPLLPLFRILATPNQLRPTKLSIAAFPSHLELCKT